MLLWNVLFASLTLIIVAWVTIFVGEFIAWRRELPSITDAPDLPPVRHAERTIPAWKQWVFGALVTAWLLPIVLLSFLVVAPPVLAATWLSRLTNRST